MTTSFIHSLQSEWLKTRRSLASWLVVLGSFLIPAIILIARLVYSDNLQKDSAAPDFWEKLFSMCWQAMALLLLPMGVILATSLIAQLEFRNNTWKQLHTTPQYLTTIFAAKLAVILAMMLQFLLLFNIGIYLVGVIPNVIFGVAYPAQAFPFAYFLEKNAWFFVDCLPIVALQYLISLHFKNFLVPLGFGLGMLVASLTAVEWEYGYTIPYTYCPLNFFTLRNVGTTLQQGANVHLWAVGYFVLFTIMGYVLYLTKKEKG
ncbi:MAG: ABC transporter permease [Saprospiraceae bacterium]|nr:ABC transporter permease [Saprospiraceae bacterium]MDZ4705361.1 ABC transporter permease [Saprospiraceae bacterium]